MTDFTKEEVIAELTRRADEQSAKRKQELRKLSDAELAQLAMQLKAAVPKKI